MTAVLLNVTVDEIALVRSMCRDNFYFFVQEFWDTVVPEKPIWNWHVEYLCNEFQADAQRVFMGLPKLYDTIVNIPPGSTKSTILSIMAPAWILSIRPDMRILAASHTQDLTLELGRKCRMVLESEKYQKTFPDTVPSKDQWTKSLFMTTKGGGRKASTVGGMSPVGFHAHFILVDDPLDPQQAKKATEKEIETANNFMSEVIPTRKVDKEVAPTWLIMQRLHQNDPTGYLLKKQKDIRHICLPAERSKGVKPGHLRSKYSKGGLLDPTRLSRKILDEAKIMLGEFAYAGQYRQEPVPRGGGMFKVGLIKVGTPPPLSGKVDGTWVGLCRFWDKAGTSGGGAYTVGMLMGRYRPTGADRDGSEDVWWILDVIRGQWDSGEREKIIKKTAKMDGRKVLIGIEQEPGSGGKESAENTIKRLAGYKAQAIPAVGNKVDRADTWSDLVNVGGFRIARDTWKDGDDKKTSWNWVLIEEMRFFPYSEYKDQVDAGSGAYAILSKGRRRVGAMPGGGRRKAA